MHLLLLLLSHLKEADQQWGLHDRTVVGMDFRVAPELERPLQRREPVRRFLGGIILIECSGLNESFLNRTAFIHGSHQWRFDGA
ncbi:hypothetical protein DPMN_040713 [Dreissena polymorpha]|uniref:Secreted protein n=1 Tax=Dreissena polymorpha TaxID=45954 RepID=A0A9D4HVG3_DREPO|nr:hypothetical protein DPMN_040713 [Dreissena polymorpha]